MRSWGRRPTIQRWYKPLSWRIPMRRAKQLYRSLKLLIRRRWSGSWAGSHQFEVTLWAMLYGVQMWSGLLQDHASCNSLRRVAYLWYSLADWQAWWRRCTANNHQLSGISSPCYWLQSTFGWTWNKGKGNCRHKVWIRGHPRRTRLWPRGQHPSFSSQVTRNKAMKSSKQ